MVFDSLHSHPAPVGISPQIQTLRRRLQARSFHDGIVPRMFSFLAVVLAGELLLRRSLSALLELSLGSDYYTYIAAIPAVTVCLICFEKKRIFADISYCPAAAAAMLPMGIIMVLLDRIRIRGLPPGTSLALTILADLAFVIAAFAFYFGTEAFRAALFPLAFLALMAPLPPFILDRITVPLQTVSTEISYRIFQLLYIPVSRQGYTLSLPHVTIEVGRECSSIRSSTAMVLAALLTGHLFLRYRWTRTALVIAALPIAVIKNAIRISFLSVLALYVNPGVFQSPLHRRGGIVFFSMGLALLVLLLYWLRYLEARKRS